MKTAPTARKRALSVALRGGGAESADRPGLQWGWGSKNGAIRGHQAASHDFWGNKIAVRSGRR